MNKSSLKSTSAPPSLSDIVCFVVLNEGMFSYFIFLLFFDGGKKAKKKKKGEEEDWGTIRETTSHIREIEDIIL